MKSQRALLSRLGDGIETLWHSTTQLVWCIAYATGFLFIPLGLAPYLDAGRRRSPERCRRLGH